jgi:type VI secretion system protein ImpJ
MAVKEVHWYDGMFLRTIQFQAEQRLGRERLKESEDWFHPYNWGLRSVELDHDAIANGTLALRSCEARFRDGTKLTIPSDVAVEPIPLRGALRGGAPVTAFLAVPTWQSGRANVAGAPPGDGPRYWIDTQECPDENTGGEGAIQIRRVRARLLLSDRDAAGYEVLPLARITPSSQAEASPQLDRRYVPPLLALNAWPPLWQDVQSLSHQLGATIDLLTEQVKDRGITFDSQVPGDAERMLKLMTLNGASTVLGAAVSLRGLPPPSVYLELCRLVGQLALFGDERRPPPLPPYDHEDLGGCFAAVIERVRSGLGAIGPRAFEKRYFERVGDRLQVGLDPAWLAGPRSLYLGVETDASDRECQQLLESLELKVAGGSQVEQIFLRRLRGLALTPVARPPRALPAGPGIVYFQVEHDQVFWRDVVASCTLGIRMNLACAGFQDDRSLAVVPPGGRKVTKLQFALFIT